ncbi:MAG: universal stress protein [Flavobacteriales bacterium]|nr:universal stress protein [Flavobacteriales bacterium]
MKILVPIDFGSNTGAIINSAKKIAELNGATIRLLYVVEPGIDKFLEEDKKFSDISDGLPSEKMVDNYFRKLGLSMDISSFETKSIYAKTKASLSIIYHAEQYEADLIVMGAFGSGKTEFSSVGSTSERVLRNCNIPVLIIKDRAIENIDNVVITSAFHGEINNIFGKQWSIIKKFKPKLHLLKVITPARFQTTKDSLAVMENFVYTHNLNDTTFNTYADRSVEAGILSFSEKINADLTLITTHPERSIYQLFRGKLGDQLVKSVQTPILSVKINKVPAPNITAADVYKDEFMKDDFEASLLSL